MSTFTDLWKQHDFAGVAASIASRTPAEVRRALAREGRGLSLDDLAALLSPAAAPFLEEMAALSHRLTVERFGRTMQLYAPMYLTKVIALLLKSQYWHSQKRVALFEKYPPAYVMALTWRPDFC